MLVNKTSFKLRSVSYKETLYEVKSIRNECCAGNDKIPISLVKLVAENIASPLTCIINECIRLSVFPTEWKYARINAIPKKQNPTTGDDYRQISILPVLSKVFERLIMKQIYNYVKTNNIYSSTQAGYRCKHSTNTILFKMRDGILNAMNKGEVTLSILEDFGKAFSTVDYTVLIKKLSKLNMSPEFLHLILSCISDRSQYVQIHSDKSHHERINFSVPQGSILGPILFKIYVSNMNNESDSPCIQHGDDTNCYEHCKVSDILQSITTLLNSAKSICACSRDNNLVFNPEKTKFMLFSPKQMSTKHKLNKMSNKVIINNNSTLDRVTNSSILGVNFDENLNWEYHITKVIKTCYSTLAPLRKRKRLMILSSVNNLVNS